MSCGGVTHKNTSNKPGSYRSTFNFPADKPIPSIKIILAEKYDTWWSIIP